jgi:hypothetical protein
MGYNPSLYVDSARVEPLKGEVLVAEERVQRLRDVRESLTK